MTRGLRDKAAVTIREMARVNKKPIPVDLEKRLGDRPFTKLKYKLEFWINN